MSVMKFGYIFYWKGKKMYIPKEILDPITGEITTVMTEKSSNIAERFATASKIQRKLGFSLQSYGIAKRKPCAKSNNPLLHRRKNRIITENMRNVLTEITS